MNEMTRHDTKAAMLALGAEAKAAAAALRLATAETKNRALAAMAAALRTRTDEILAANAHDLAEAAGLTGAMRDRLYLDAARVAAMADGVDAVAGLPDPVGRTLAEWTRPNGLRIARLSVPIGVIGLIYESRPNVTADAGALCLKSGNVAILRGGSESFHSARVIHACLVEGLLAAGLPPASITRVPTPDREAVGMMLAGLGGAIDLIVPRGGKGLVARVQAEARVPVLAHLEGICHVYVDRDADLEKAIAITVNSKLRRTGVCGAAETLLIDKAVAASHGVPILRALRDGGTEIRGDAAVQALLGDVVPATQADWTTEYLDAIIAVRLVDGVAQAIEHIAAYGSNHTDAIVTESPITAERFLREVDSAITLWNASTQFADGGEFGFGAEIGIATGKLHARGPVGVEQLTSYKYVVRGAGQIRP